MTPEEKWEIRMNIILDFEDGLLSEDEFNSKIIEFDEKYEDKEYLKWILENIYPKGSKTYNYYLKKYQA